MSIISNFDQAIAAVLKGLGNSLNLARSRRGNARLGDQFADIIASGIQERTITQQKGGEGMPLAPLKSRTLARKRRLGFPSTIGVETGEMLSIEQVRGQVAFSEDTLVMIDGLAA